MYKKHGRDQEANLELQVKALVAKALEEQGLSTEPRILVTPPGELTLVGSPLKVPSSQGSTVATIPVDRIREPTISTLVFLSGRQNIVNILLVAYTIIIRYRRTTLGSRCIP